MPPIFSKPQPAAIIKSVSEIVPKTMAKSLVALIHYGGNGQDLTADNLAGPIRVLIVLESVGPQSLDQLSQGYRNIVGKDRVAPMVLTVEEMHASTDVFPITFLEMRKNYRVLAGRDVLTDLNVSFNHLRLRCEQELKNLLLRMQNRYLTQHDNNKLFETLQTNTRSFTRTLSAALLLVDANSPTDDLQVIKQAAERFGFDEAQGVRVLEVVNAASTLKDDALRSTYAVLMELVSQAATTIDQLKEQEITVIEVLE